MKNEFLKIPIIISFIFLVTSLLSQTVLGLLGGLMIHLFSKMFGFKSWEIETEFMSAVVIISIIWAIIAKSNIQQWLSSFFVFFSICNTILFFSYGNLKEYFYPDRYIIGLLLSLILLIGIGLIKKKRAVNKS